MLRFSPCLAYALAAVFLVSLGAIPDAQAEEAQESPLLQSILYGADKKPADKKEVRTMPEPTGPATPRQRLSIGLNYTGGQIRWRLSPRWATEGRMQFGSADSDYGRVHAQVFGLRLYRFIPAKWERISWYLGGEGAYAKAQATGSIYETKGFAMGAFTGMEYRLAARLSLGLDIGPYVISLKETHTDMASTGLDFVVNTGLNWYLF